jgi:hypothetical protein
VTGVLTAERKRGGLRSPALHIARSSQSAIGLLIVAIVVETASRTELISSRYFPPLSETFMVFLQQLTEGSFWASIGQTMSGWSIGLVLAALLTVQQVPESPRRSQSSSLSSPNWSLGRPDTAGTSISQGGGALTFNVCAYHHHGHSGRPHQCRYKRYGGALPALAPVAKEDGRMSNKTNNPWGPGAAKGCLP